MANENDQPTCGKGLAANSWLPAKLSELTAALSDVLAHHMTALDENEENGKQEFDAYKNLVKRYREVAAQLDDIAKEMENDRDLPVADHDMNVMTSPESLDVFESFVRRKQELRDLLQKTVEDDEKMLSQMSEPPAVAGG